MIAKEVAGFVPSNRIDCQLKRNSCHDKSLVCKNEANFKGLYQSLFFSTFYVAYQHLVVTAYMHLYEADLVSGVAAP